MIGSRSLSVGVLLISAVVGVGLIGTALGVPGDRVAVVDGVQVEAILTPVSEFALPASGVHHLRRVPAENARDEAYLWVPDQGPMEPQPKIVLSPTPVEAIGGPGELIQAWTITRTGDTPAAPGEVASMEVRARRPIGLAFGVRGGVELAPVARARLEEVLSFPGFQMVNAAAGTFTRQWSDLLALMRDAPVAGRLLLRAYVAQDGTVTMAAVDESSGNADLDRALRQGAFAYRFTPIDLYGIPVEAWIYLSYSWGLGPEESVR